MNVSQEGLVQGETVPYVICVEKDAEGNVGPNQKGLAERAHHPEEINAASNLAVDAEYYLAQQVCFPEAVKSPTLLLQFQPFLYLPICDFDWLNQLKLRGQACIRASGSPCLYAQGYGRGQICLCALVSA